METNAVQVQFAIDDAERGAAIAAALLQARLASCVQQVGPMTSRYRWRGALEEAQEWLFVAKTTAARTDEVITAIAAQHPYDVPEIVVTAVIAGYRPYLEWNGAETADD